MRWGALGSAAGARLLERQRDKGVLKAYTERCSQPSRREGTSLETNIARARERIMRHAQPQQRAGAQEAHTRGNTPPAQKPAKGRDNPSRDCHHETVSSLAAVLAHAQAFRTPGSAQSRAWTNQALPLPDPWPCPIVAGQSYQSTTKHTTATGKHNTQRTETNTNSNAQQ